MAKKIKSKAGLLDDWLEKRDEILQRERERPLGYQEKNELVFFKLGTKKKPMIKENGIVKKSIKKEKPIIGILKSATKNNEPQISKKITNKNNLFIHKNENITKRLNEIKKTIGVKLNKQVEIKTERIESGVDGLDKIINGGLPKNSFILLAGSCGTGKFTFAMNFLMHGTKNKEPGIYLSLEESAEETIEHADNFGFNIGQEIKNGRILIFKPELYDFDRLLSVIEDSIVSLGAKRLVINSISHLGSYFKDPYKVREAILELMKMLKRNNCTAIAISEKPENSESLSPFGVEEFIADGVIIMHYTKKESVFVRGLSVRKMRYTTHSTEIHSIQIKSPDGIKVYPSEQVFSEFT